MLQAMSHSADKTIKWCLFWLFSARIPSLPCNCAIVPRHGTSRLLSVARLALRDMLRSNTMTPPQVIWNPNGLADIFSVWILVPMPVENSWASLYRMLHDQIMMRKSCPDLGPPRWNNQISEADSWPELTPATPRLGPNNMHLST